MVRTGPVELAWSAVLEDPVPAVRKLMAQLGEAHDETLLRHLIENYPGAGREAQGLTCAEQGRRSLPPRETGDQKPGAPA